MGTKFSGDEFELSCPEGLQFSQKLGYCVESQSSDCHKLAKTPEHVKRYRSPKAPSNQSGNTSYVHFLYFRCELVQSSPAIVAPFQSG